MALENERNKSDKLSSSESSSDDDDGDFVLPRMPIKGKLCEFYDQIGAIKGNFQFKEIVVLSDRSASTQMQLAHKSWINTDDGILAWPKVQKNKKQEILNSIHKFLVRTACSPQTIEIPWKVTRKGISKVSRFEYCGRTLD